MNDNLYHKDKCDNDHALKSRINNTALSSALQTYSHCFKSQTAGTRTITCTRTQSHARAHIYTHARTHARRRAGAHGRTQGYRSRFCDFTAQIGVYSHGSQA